MIGAEAAAHLTSLVESARDKWFDESTKSIEDRVTAILDKNLKMIVSKLLGFDNRWGDGWEIDHCNGRSGNTEFGQAITAQIHEAVEKIVAAECKKWKPTAAQKKAIATEYARGFQDRAKRTAYDRGQRDVDSYVDSIVYSAAYQADLEEVLADLNDKGKKP